MNDAYFNALCFLMALIWVSALTRLWVRGFLVKTLGWDDAAMLATLAASSAFIGMELAVTVYTDLQSLDKIPFEKVFPAIRMTLATLLLYIVASVFLKIALATLLLRVLYIKWQRIVIYTVMSISIAYGTFYMFYVLFECGNPQEFPDKIIQGHCLTGAQIDGTSYTHAVWNALADLTFLLLPIALLYKQDMTFREKLSIGAILGVGSIGGICTIIRIPFINSLTEPTVTFLETAKPVALLSAIELSVGLTCICIATFKPLIQLFNNKIYEYRHSREASRQPPVEQAYCVACGRGDHVHEGNNLKSTDGSTIERHLTRTTSRSTKKWSRYGEMELDSPMSPQSPV